MILLSRIKENYYIIFESKLIHFFTFVKMFRKRISQKNLVNILGVLLTLQHLRYKTNVFFDIFDLSYNLQKKCCDCKFGWFVMTFLFLCQVRGPNYLNDRVKYESMPSMFECVKVHHFLFL